MTNILVYQDFIHNSFPVYRALCETFGAQATRFCTAQDLRDGCLTPAVDLFVMPGGADLYYVEKLAGAPDSAISHYVRSGGRYLGICGGAYYAARSIAYAPGTPHAVCGPRALAFFGGLAAGPVGPPTEMDEDGFQPPRLISLKLFATPEDAKAVYWGGPTFIVQAAAQIDEQSPEANETEVLAHYDLPDAPSAIIRTRVGMGRAVLCGVHPEISPNDLEGMAYARNGTRDSLMGMAADLRAAAPNPRALWTQIMDWTME